MNYYFVADNTRSDEFRRLRAKARMSVVSVSKSLGEKESTVNNWAYGKSERIPESIMVKMRELAGEDRSEVSPPSIPVPLLKIPVPHIGGVSASEPVNWTDPFATVVMEEVPPEMGHGRGRFSCYIKSDSMVPLLYEEDLCVFQADPAKKLNTVVLFRSTENLLTIKTLKHDGTHYYLHPENPTYEDIRAEGTIVGHLVGVVRTIGSRMTTEYDPNGIRP